MALAPRQGLYQDMLNQHAIMLLPLISNGRKVIITLTAVITYFTACDSLIFPSNNDIMLRSNNYFAWYVCGFWLGARLIL